jgi:hypothetical protein
MKVVDTITGPLNKILDPNENSGIPITLTKEEEIN